MCAHACMCLCPAISLLAFVCMCLSDPEIAGRTTVVRSLGVFFGNRGYERTGQHFRAMSFPAAVFKILILFQDYLCIIRILVNTYNIVQVQCLFWFWHFIKIRRNTVRYKLLLGTTIVLKVRVTVFLTCAQQQTSHYCCAQGSFYRSVKFISQTALTEIKEKQPQSH